MKSIISILHFLIFCAVELPAVKAACGYSSAITALESVLTGKDFCSTLLYPGGATVVATTTLSFTYTVPPCKTKTVKITSDILTVTKTKTTTLPVIKYYLYTSTVLVASGTHRTVNKRQASSTSTSSTSTTTSANTASASAAAVSADAQATCSPTPTEVCKCPAASISAACSYLVPPPEDITSTVYDDTTVTCTSKDSYTTTVYSTTITTTYTETGAPPLQTISKDGTLTRTVPAACAGTPYKSGKKPDPDGTEEVFGYYPYKPVFPVDCCVFCYNSDAFPNCVASLFSYDLCTFVLQVNQTANEKTSPQCPLGIVNYNFNPNPAGVDYPGPCGY